MLGLIFLTIRLNPRDVTAHVNRGDVRRLRGEHEAAVADYTAALELDPANADVLCAKRQRDGSLNGPVKIRPACRAGEVTLTPDMVGFCCTVTTTTTSTTAMTCPSTTTTLAPNCQGSGGNCIGVCSGGQTCADDGTGHCVCTGTLQCDSINGSCGGSCPPGQTCQPFPGCPGPCVCR